MALLKQEGVKEFDVVIVGGGPAGLSAGVWLARFLHDVAVVDAGDPRNWQTREIHGFLGLEKASPETMRHRGRVSCRAYGATLIDARAVAVKRDGESRFFFELDDKQRLVGRRVLLAPGVQDRWPEIEGLNRCFGTTVHTCPNCDGYESQGTMTAVIGAGWKAAAVAMALKTWTDSILLCTHGEEPTYGEETARTLDGAGVAIRRGRIKRLDREGKYLQALEFAGGDRLACEHLFIALGQYARGRDLGTQLGCKRDARGFIEVDGYHHTSVENVFAAGDISAGAQMAMRAAAGGAEAALSIHHSLIPEERRVHRRC